MTRRATGSVSSTSLIRPSIAAVLRTALPHGPEAPNEAQPYIMAVQEAAKAMANRRRRLEKLCGTERPLAEGMPQTGLHWSEPVDFLQV